MGPSSLAAAIVIAVAGAFGGQFGRVGLELLKGAAEARVALDDLRAAHPVAPCSPCTPCPVQEPSPPPSAWAAESVRIALVASFLAGVSASASAAACCSRLRLRPRAALESTAEGEFDKWASSPPRVRRSLKRLAVDARTL